MADKFKEGSDEWYLNGDFVGPMGIQFLEFARSYTASEEGRAIKREMLSDQLIAACRSVGRLVKHIDPRFHMLRALGVNLSLYPATQTAFLCGVLYGRGLYKPDLTYNFSNAVTHEDTVNEVEDFLKGLGDSDAHGTPNTD